MERLRLPADVHRWELVEGKLEVLTPTNAEHASVVARLAYLLHRDAPGWRILAGDPGLYVQRRPDTIRGADVLVISEPRYVQRDPSRAFLTVAPELVIEVISPSNQPEDIERKTGEYVSLGCAVWIVNVDARTVEIVSRGDRGLVEQLTAPNGASFPVAELFR
jgi:Uma2 family endonuclease